MGTSAVSVQSEELVLTCCKYLQLSGVNSPMFDFKLNTVCYSLFRR
jgi:hypothetical protein